MNLTTPLNPDGLLNILRRCVKGRGQKNTQPIGNDPSLVCLVGIINRMCELDKMWTGGVLAQHVQERQAIRDAIQTIAALLPGHRRIYKENEIITRRAVEQHGEQFAEFANTARHDLEVFEALSAAVNSAIEAGLPIGHFEIGSPNHGAPHSPRFRWRGFTRPLADAFHSALPGRSKEDGYRFVQAVIPVITGDDPSIDNIKEALKTASREKVGNKISQEKKLH